MTVATKRDAHLTVSVSYFAKEQTKMIRHKKTSEEIPGLTDKQQRRQAALNARVVKAQAKHRRFIQKMSLYSPSQHLYKKRYEASSRAEDLALWLVAFARDQR
jgi:hypothetical protein